MEKTFPGLVSVVLCHKSLTANLTLIVQNLLNGLFLLTLTVHPLSHRPFFHFLSSFLCGGRSSIDKCKTHHQLVSSLFCVHRQHFVLSTNFPPFTPPALNLQEESLAMCHTFSLTLIHMQIRILFRFFFSLYTNAWLGSPRVASHVNTRVPLRRLGSVACSR